MPKPPKLPDYDPEEESPKWNWRRLRFGYTKTEGKEEWTAIGDVPKDPNKPDWRGVVRNNIIEIPPPGKYEFGQPQVPRYFWFDTPDYADPFKKLWYSFKFFTLVGIGYCGFAGCALGAEHKDLRFVLSRTFRPFFLGGMTTSLAVLTIANLRGKKDDYWNYAIGGFVTACTFGHNNHYKWTRNLLFWIPAAVAMKYNAETNGVLWIRSNPRLRYFGLSGQSAEHGPASGDFRLHQPNEGDPGRGLRTYAL